MIRTELLPGSPKGPGISALELPPPKARELLEGTKWAEQFSLTEMDSLVRYLQPFAAEKDAVVVREGARESYLCLVARGRVSIRKRSSEGADREIGKADAGKAFGEMSLIDGEPRSASVVAMEPAVFLILSGRNFMKMTLEVPRLAIKLLLKIARMTSQRLRQASGALVDFLG